MKGKKKNRAKSKWKGLGLGHLKKTKDQESPLVDAVSSDGVLSQQGVEIGTRSKLRVYGKERDHGIDINSFDELEDLGVSLGKGSGGTVKMMMHLPTETRVAIKQISLSVAEDVREKLFREIRTHHKSSHPNVVEFYGAFYFDSDVYIALECMKGSLKDLLRLVKALPEEILVHIAWQVLQGLVYLHKDLHLVHRDIKPANILLNTRGQVKVADFGVSGEIENTLGLAKTFVGTSWYMDPDRIEGKHHSSTADVWSFGLTIMECALGYFPYTPPGQCTEDLGYFDIHEAVVKRDAPRLPSDQFSEPFCDIIEKCLMKNLFKRPASEQLLKHAWFETREDMDLSDYFTTALKMRRG